MGIKRRIKATSSRRSPVPQPVPAAQPVPAPIEDNGSAAAWFNSQLPDLLEATPSLEIRGKIVASAARGLRDRAEIWAATADKATLSEAEWSRLHREIIETLSPRGYAEVFREPYLETAAPILVDIVSPILERASKSQATPLDPAQVVKEAARRILCDVEEHDVRSIADTLLRDGTIRAAEHLVGTFTGPGRTSVSKLRARYPGALVEPK